MPDNSVIEKIVISDPANGGPISGSPTQDIGEINQPEIGEGIPGINRDASLLSDPDLTQKGPDQKAPAGPSGDSSGEDAEAEDGQAAPMVYATFILPDGVEADENLLGEFQETAREFGLNQSQAQRLVDLQANAAARLAEEHSKTWVDQQSEWVAGVRSDGEIGGAGMQQKLGVAATAIERFGTPALKQVLNDQGFGNHPELIRFAYRVGKAMSQDMVFVAPSGSGFAGGEKSLAQRIYPDQTPT